MADKNLGQHFPEEDTSGTSTSSASGAGRGQSRYKPLAPKAPLSAAANAPQRLQSPRSGAGEATQQVQDLTFVNMTDPQQSKSRESRKFVRSQVMVNFAREKRRQKAPSSPGSAQASISSSKAVSEVQELLNAAIPNVEGAGMTDWSFERGPLGPGSPISHNLSDPPTQLAQATIRRPGHTLQQPKPVPHPPAARLLPSPASRTSNLPGVKSPHWPLPPEAHVQGLVNHCHSPSFRACHPLYMVSLLANRPSAENYPFFVDIDSAEEVSFDYRASHVLRNEFHLLAEGSTMLAHALLMVSASHLAIIEPEDAATRTRQAINHKSRALQLLNEAIKGLPGKGYLETLATIAVLASHELIVNSYQEWTVHVMGFGRIVNMKGGLTSLPLDNYVRKLIIWTDQMGALLMNMRPFFPATEVMSLFFRPRSTIPPSLFTGRAQQEDFLSPAFRKFAIAFYISAPLTEILEDITTIRTVGVENIMNAATPAPNLSILVDMRDVLVHRILSLAPAGNDVADDDESSAEECARLAALTFVLDRLFVPLLPPAYHRIAHLVTDRLNTSVEGKSASREWAAHGWVLMWIVFTGATVHSGDPTTTRSLIQSAAPLCAHLFTSRQPQQMSLQLKSGLAGVIGRPELFKDELVDGFAAALEQACRV